MSAGFERRVPVRLKNLRIDSVDSVDKGASGSRGSRGAVVTLMKRDFDTNDATAQALVKCAGTDKVSKAELSALIEKLSHARRSPGDTAAIAYTKFICDDPLGRELFRAMMADRHGMDHRQVAAAAINKKIAEGRRGEETDPVGERIDPDANPFHAALNALARRHVEKNPGMSIERAFTHLATHDATAKKLMVHAKEWDLQRAHAAQS